ncbi:hypothetical protein Tco_0584371 [Tanacetum coccineum]
MSRRSLRLFSLLISLNLWMLRVCGKNSNHLAALWMLSSLISVQKLIGSYHVYVSTTKFQRQANTESNPKKNVGPDPHSYVTPLRPNSSNNAPLVFPSKWSYASVANGSAAPKRFPNNDVHESSKRDYRYGFKTCEAFKSNDSLKSFWATIKTVSPSFIVGERLIWIESAGLPLFAWGSNDLKKVTSLFGKFKFFDSEEADAMSMGRSRTSNGDENSNEDIDDYIEQIMEEKANSNFTKESLHENKEDVCQEPNSTDSKRPGYEAERIGSSFSRRDAEIFNAFIHDASLIDLPIGGRRFTWMNKTGSKLSKLDRFLISNSVFLEHSNYRNDFDDIVKEAWSGLSNMDGGPLLSLNGKVKDSLRVLNEKIDAGMASEEEKILRVNNWYELDNLEKLKSKDLFQKARVKWDVKGLHIALKDGLSSNMFRGVNVGSPGIRLSHLFYADDVIIFSDWNQHDTDNIIRILNIFYLASGLRININKSNLHRVGVSHSEVKTMAAGSGCSPSYLPFSYFGLPIGSNMSHILNWKVLIDHFKSKLSGWKASLLSSGGRLTLIKSVLGSLNIYFLSIFKAPKAVIKVLEVFVPLSFWGASVEKRKLAWVKWSNILAPLKKGSLGVGSLKAFNLSLLLKWRWRLMKDSSALWVKVLKSIHGDEAGFELVGCKTNRLWARIVGSIYQLHSSGCIPLNTFRFNVGDGSLIQFWKDIWLGDQPLCARYNRLFHLEKNRSCLIRDRIANSSWSWD